MKGLLQFFLPIQVVAARCTGNGYRLSVYRHTVEAYGNPMNRFTR